MQENKQWNDLPAPPPPPTRGRTASRKRLMKRAGIVVAALVVFGLGWMLGDGRLQFNSAQNDTITIANTEQTSTQLSTDGLQEIFDLLVEKYDGEVKPDELLDGLKAGAVEAVGDRFTEYLNEQETQEFNEGLNGTFEGIGAELSKDGEFVIIVSPIRGTPAEAAGIQPQDIIVEIDGNDAIGITVNDAVSQIRGEKGTTVTLTIVRDGARIEVPITRGTIDIASVEWVLDGSVGVIQIGRFGDDTVSLARQAAQELRDQGASSIVLDVRGNPGGLLDAAVGVSSIWLEAGTTVLEERQGDQVVKTLTASGGPILQGVPTVVLINEGSASASEIVAGALKDNGAAQLLGQKSFGKGSVQQLIDLKGGGSLKVTVARWFTPAGKNIDQEGIEPDTAVEVTQQNIDDRFDVQLDEAKKLLNQ